MPKNSKNTRLILKYSIPEPQTLLKLSQKFFGLERTLEAIKQFEDDIL